MPVGSEFAGYQVAVTIGFPEALIVLAIVLLLFGGKRLPEVGDALGRAIRNFRKGADEAADEPPEESESQGTREIAEAKEEPAGSERPEKTPEASGEPRP